MLITACAYRGSVPSSYSSGLVFSSILGPTGSSVPVFVGTYQAATRAEVIRLAYLNARIAQMRYRLGAKMRVS